jgi:hypothetical protein
MRNLEHISLIVVKVIGGKFHHCVPHALQAGAKFDSQSPTPGMQAVIRKPYARSPIKDTHVIYTSRNAAAKQVFLPEKSAIATVLVRSFDANEEITRMTDSSFHEEASWRQG